MIYLIFEGLKLVFLSTRQEVYKFDRINYEHNDLKSISNELTFMSIDLDERDQIYKNHS